MAMLDTGASNLVITTYDTAGNASRAAARAVDDGNRLMLGPLLPANVARVAGEARVANVPVVSFSGEPGNAVGDIFLMGQSTEQSVSRVVRYARANGARRFAALVPEGEYGQRAVSALRMAVSDFGGSIIDIETYDKGNTSIRSAAQRILRPGTVDAVLMADGPRFTILGAEALGSTGPRIMGTELWSGRGEFADAPALRGATFAAVSDERFGDFVQSYRQRFGATPYRISVLGYDAVLLTLRVAQDWPSGAPFPTQALRSEAGFLGLDGPFRFGADGMAQRSMEVREVRDGRIVVVDPAPRTFGG